ncbi:MAG: SDR family oxidoreductase [Acidobacteria bacterium]|nr:SDR family oxidoreductase [Acidobacteriota bacterium]MCW5971660.1 SDR family oxidoreductase [Blastocatellales bacterium]
MNFIGDFTGKVVLITGAARGIGRETARQFAACGARLALHYRSSRTEAEAAHASLDGQSHALFQADLTSPAEAARLVEEVLAEMGRIDVLVNNAAVFELHRIAEVGYEEWQSAWRRTIDANLIGAANLIYCTSQHMIAQRSGRIINISSRGAFRGEPEAPAYGASKAALNAMSQSLAQALAPHNVFVYVIAPGFVDTERVAWKVHGPQGDAIREQSPLGRVARPEEVARTALFLASEGTDFLTGCIVDVNGASYLRT